jgi:hypothetical protein
MLARIEALRALQARAQQASEKSRAAFERRGQLAAARARGAAAGPGAPWLPLAAAGRLPAGTPPTAARRVPAAGVLRGHRHGQRRALHGGGQRLRHRGRRASSPWAWRRSLRAQELALENRLPFVHLVESAGANLLRYQVGRLRARRRPSSATSRGCRRPGCRVVDGRARLVHGRRRLPCRACRDYVDRWCAAARALFLAGPPLLKAGHRRDRHRGGARRRR